MSRNEDYDLAFGPNDPKTNTRHRVAGEWEEMDTENMINERARTLIQPIIGTRGDRSKDPRRKPTQRF